MKPVSDMTSRMDATRWSDFQPGQAYEMAGRSSSPEATTLNAPGVLNFMTASLLMAGLVTKMAINNIGGNGVHSRKKRNLGLNDVFSRERNVFYRVLGDLDQEDCIALSICHASSIDLFNKERNDKLLSALAINKDAPVPWKDITEIRAKFQYAAFVGHSLGVDEVKTGCKSAFPGCALPAEDVLKLLTNEVRSCESMMVSLEKLLPEEVQNSVTGNSTTADLETSASSRSSRRARKRHSDYTFSDIDIIPRRKLRG